ncbi:MAG TPA: DNA-3-methyladenine glycosylase [Kofleriaceae bacterium]|nr:DNA-3-methyladenine glycosylase [Kofleriaceae bacterium]
MTKKTGQVEHALDQLKATRLDASFFARDVLVVARALVGCALVHGRRAGVIVETEAYQGPEDAASHARFGPTARTEVMFGPGGVAYVYLCYGIHEMFNIVTGTAGEGQAVLIRAIAPLVGLADDPEVGRGPGKVTKALAIDRRHDRRDLASGALFVAAAPERPALQAWQHVPPLAIATGPRVGVAYAGEWADRPYRFWWKGHPSVSRTPASTPVGARSGRRKTSLRTD